MEKDNNYKVEIEIVFDQDAYDLNSNTSNVKIKWLEQDIISQESFNYFGGLRLQSLMTFDGNQLESSKSYEYDKGYIVSWPYYYSAGILNDGMAFSSQNTYPLINTQQGSVGYGEVIEKIQPIAKLNTASYPTFNFPKAITRTYSKPESVGDFPTAIYVKEWTGGNMLTRDDFGKTNTNTYESVHELTNEIRCMQIPRRYNQLLYDTFAELVNAAQALNLGGCPQTNICNLSDYEYRISPSQSLLKDQTIVNKEFGLNMTTDLNFFYEGIPWHHNVTKTIKTNSDQDVITNIMHYPNEVLNVLNTDVADMNQLISENRLSLPIQQEAHKNGTVLSKTYTSFGLSGSNVLLPDLQQTAKGNDALEDRILFQKYTPYGQLRELSLVDGTITTYLWGYNYSYPVAKIENATYNDVSSIVSESGLQNLNGTALLNALNPLRAQLPDAMVTTYSYIPLIGLDQVVDVKERTSTYTYDTMGRLEFIINHEGHVLQENRYSYKQN